MKRVLYLFLCCSRQRKWSWWRHVRVVQHLRFTVVMCPTWFCFALFCCGSLRVHVMHLPIVSGLSHWYRSKRIVVTLPMKWLTKSKQTTAKHTSCAQMLGCTCIPINRHVVNYFTGSKPLEVGELKFWGLNKIAVMFTDDIFKCIVFKQIIHIDISLNFVLEDPFDKKSAQMQVTSQRWGDKSLRKPMIAHWQIHISQGLNVLRLAYVNPIKPYVFYVWQSGDFYLCLVSAYRVTGDTAYLLPQMNLPQTIWVTRNGVYAQLRGYRTNRSGHTTCNVLH